MIPPLWLIVKIERSSGRKFRLWLPILLIWPFVYAVVILLFPLVLLIAVYQLIVHRHMKILLVFPLFHNLICKLKGTLIDVNSTTEKIYLNII